MRTYSEVAMMVNGRKTCNLDIYREWNTFHIFEHDENVYSGGWSGMTEFVENWKNGWQPMIEAMTAEGMKVDWIKS